MGAVCIRKPARTPSPEFNSDEEDEPIEVDEKSEEDEPMSLVDTAPATVSIPRIEFALPQTKGTFRFLPFPGRYFDYFLGQDLASICLGYLNNSERWHCKRIETEYLENEQRLEREVNCVIEQAKKRERKRRAAPADQATAKKQKVPPTIDLTGDD
jgi:hypothetical protein